MRLIITGSRSVVKYSDLISAIEGIQLNPDAIVVSPFRTWGDRLGEMYSEAYNIPIIDVCVRYKKYGNNAENIMYLDMVNNADKLLVLWCGLTKHTQRVLKMAKLKGIDIHLWQVSALTNPEINVL